MQKLDKVRLSIKISVICSASGTLRRKNLTYGIVIWPASKNRQDQNRRKERVTKNCNLK